MRSISSDRLQYWNDESEEPQPVATMGLSTFNWLTASVLLVVVGITIAAIRKR